MKRDLKSITRDLEKRKNNDIILKKQQLLDMFNEDPDIKEVLNQLPKKPLNKFADPEHPTEDELALRKEIEDYNRKVSRPQIIPFLKLNGLQEEVLNFLMFDISDTVDHYMAPAMKQQVITVMCLVHEDDMDTEYAIVRTDLLSYLVKDQQCWTNVLGMQFKLTSDFFDITDTKYYARTIKFTADVPNVNPGHMGMNNKYDRFSRV